LEGKVYLCKDCHCCPAVEFLTDGVRIGEGENLAVLTTDEWNTLVAKIRSGELGTIREGPDLDAA